MLQLILFHCLVVGVTLFYYCVNFVGNLNKARSSLIGYNLGDFKGNACQ